MRTGNRLEVSPTVATNSSSKTGWVGITLGVLLSVVYCAAFFVRSSALWPESVRDISRYLSGGVYRVITAALEWLAVSTEGPELRDSLYLLLIGVGIPWLVLVLLGRGRPHDIGFRRPNLIGYRFLAVGYILALPFIFWMARGSDFSVYYLRQLKQAGLGAFLGFYFVNMLSEHFFFHGVLLAVCRKGQRWPEPAPGAPVSAEGIRRVLQWIGLAQETGDSRGSSRFLRWVGLSSGCIPAICVSAALFGMIHLGKHPRELVLSVPGGIALAYAAYRTNSWLIPFILHLATAGTACLIMVATD